MGNYIFIDWAFYIYKPASRCISGSGNLCNRTGISEGGARVASILSDGKDIFNANVFASHGLHLKRLNVRVQGFKNL